MMAVDLPQLDRTHCNEAVKQHQRRWLVGERALRLGAPAESPFSRSIRSVVRSDFHWRRAQRLKVSSSSPASSGLRSTSAESLGHWGHSSIRKKSHLAKRRS
jgi:hypothetical protein